MNTFSPKNKKKVANGLQFFVIFVIFLLIPLFIPLFFISVKQQHNHNSQYPEKCPSLCPFPGHYKQDSKENVRSSFLYKIPHL